MSRIHKYRAWDVRRGEMIDVTHMEFDEDGVRVRNWRYADFTLEAIGDGLTLMQFTGLLDKNGKEIYEGDVLDFNAIGSTGTSVGEVLFRNGAFCIAENDKPLRHVYDGVFGTPKVIGNIYENPVLLNGEQ